jgi:opacity protein-like surface antigen
MRIGPRSNSRHRCPAEQSGMARKILLRLVALLAALLAALPAAAQSRRAGTSEIYLGPVFTDGKSYSFDGGSSARTDTGYGLNFGFARNFNAHVSAGMDLTWSEQDYRATIAARPDTPSASRQVNGSLETGTVRFFGTYNILAGNFTPFVTGGLGWTYIDTNIPSGLPENVCWAYPWYGYYCATYVPTQSTTRFSYNVGAGLRLDAGRGVFRLLVNSQWADFGGSYGSSQFTQYRIDIGTKF